MEEERKQEGKEEVDEAIAEAGCAVALTFPVRPAHGVAGGAGALSSQAFCRAVGVPQAVMCRAQDASGVGAAAEWLLAEQRQRGRGLAVAAAECMRLLEAPAPSAEGAGEAGSAGDFGEGRGAAGRVRGQDPEEQQEEEDDEEEQQGLGAPAGAIVLSASGVVGVPAAGVGAWRGAPASHH